MKKVGKIDFSIGVHYNTNDIMYSEKETYP